MEIIEEEEEHPPDPQNEVYSMKMMMMKVEDKHCAGSQNEMDSMKIMTERLSLMLKEQKCGSASIESPVNMGGHKTSSIITSKATGEKEMKVEVKKL
jgi:hypothetical protein